MSPQPTKPSFLKRLKNYFKPRTQTRDQLLLVLQQARHEQLIDEDTHIMIKGVLKVTDLKVRDAMVPSAQMMVVNGNETPAQALPRIIQTAHSRFPVLDKKNNKVLGILLAKDLLQFSLQKKKIQGNTLKDLVRPAIFIPESKRLNRLLEEFRLNRNHMAIVVDEYGDVSGLITIEDVLEEIVGEIEDEYDSLEGDVDIKQINQNEYTVKASTPLADFNAYFSTQYASEDVDTIGGLTMQRLGRLPKCDDSLTLDTLSLTVILANRRAVQLLRVLKG